jgi:predicted DNA binding protein
MDVEWNKKPNLKVLKSVDYINSITPIGMGGKTTLYLVGINHPEFFIDILKETMMNYLCFLDFPIVINKDEVIIRIVATQESLNKVLGIIEDFGLNFEIQAVTNYSPIGPEVFNDLTYLQYKYLKNAVEQGFFDIPKRIDIRGLAKREKISHNTLSQHIRKGTGKVMKKLFG